MACVEVREDAGVDFSVDPPVEATPSLIVGLGVCGTAFPQAGAQGQQILQLESCCGFRVKFLVHTAPSDL